MLIRFIIGLYVRTPRVDFHWAFVLGSYLILREPCSECFYLVYRTVLAVVKAVSRSAPAFNQVASRRMTDPSLKLQQLQHEAQDKLQFGSSGRA